MTLLDRYGPGLHLDIPADEYHARAVGVATSGALRLLVDHTPARLRHWYDEGSTDSPALRLGRLVHLAVLEPDLYGSQCVELPTEPDFGDCRRKANKAERDAWRAANWPDDEDPRERVSATEAAIIAGVRAACEIHPIASDWLDSAGHREATILWRDRDTGIACQARPDLYIPGVCIVDLKTCRDAGPREFAASCARYGYHVQEAHYRAAVASLGERLPFHFLAVESAAPHDAGVYQLDYAARKLGDDERRGALRRLGQCLEADSWPGQSPELRELELPAWRYSRATSPGWL